MLPKVSCILPCGYGDKYVAVAIQCFLNQTYQGELELVIVDNNDAEITFGVEIPTDVEFLKRVSVNVHKCKRMSVGALRNIGTKLATGEVCISWDEDDWSSQDRVAEQVKRLQESGKAVTGWHNILYFDTTSGNAYKYFYEPSGRNHPPYAMGTSQCYLKSWWEKHPFPEDQAVEDLGFQQEALHRNQLDSCDPGQLCVARVHSSNVCPKQLGALQFPAVSREALPKEFYFAIGDREVTQQQ